MSVNTANLTSVSATSALINETEDRFTGGFCSDDLWDTDLLVTSSWPRLTSCFLHTVLVYVPFACLWCPLPVYLYRLITAGPRPLPISCLSVFKMSLSLAMCILSFVIILDDASNDGVDNVVIPGSRYLAYSIRAISYATMVLLVYIERRYHETTSVIQFVLWSVLALCDVVPLYTNIMMEEYNTAFLHYCAFWILYVLELVQAALTCVSDSLGVASFHQRTTPELKASYPSQIFYWWVTRTVYTGWRRDLQESDLFDLNPRDTCETLVTHFDREWAAETTKFLRKRGRSRSNNLDMGDISESCNGSSEKTKLIGPSKSTSPAPDYSGMDHNQRMEARRKQPKPSLMWVLARMNVGPLTIGLTQKIISDLFLLLCPVLLSLLIEYADNADTDYAWKGYALAVLLFVSQMFKSVLFNFSFWSSQICGMQLKTTLISAIYRKALTMNNEARKESTAGEIVNLMSVDCQRVQDMMNFFFFAWTTPLQIVIAIAILYQYIGASAFAGLAVLLMTVPFNSYLATKQQELQRTNLKHKDSRLRLTNEALSGMKVLKLYAWEPPFQEKISEIREQETKVLLQIAYLNAVISVCFNAAPYLVTLATFAVYVSVDDSNQLDASKAFVALSFFNILRVPLTLLSSIISMTVQAKVSLERINEFLCTGDLNQGNVRRDGRAAFAIEVTNGTFTWEKGSSPTLRNINLRIPEGKLHAVVGPVGSGKSSLVSALLGEMEKLSGNAVIKSRVAYVPQQAWIQNATVKDNILFGKPFNRKKYKKVIQACALERDLEILSAGDMTEIGEKGINLSGGQKQRVSLARAVYSGADIYVFDDPLSAVDTHVGKHIFTQVIGRSGILKGKTRLLVTHGAHWLPMVDSIVVMTSGQISETGSYEDLMSHNGAFAEFIRTYLLQESEENEADEDVRAVKAQLWMDFESAASDGLTSGDEGAALARRASKRQNTVSTKQRRVRRNVDSFSSTIEEDSGGERLTELAGVEGGFEWEPITSLTSERSLRNEPSFTTGVSRHGHVFQRQHAFTYPYGHHDLHELPQAADDEFPQLQTSRSNRIWTLTQQQKIRRQAFFEPSPPKYIHEGHSFESEEGATGHAWEVTQAQVHREKNEEDDHVEKRIPDTRLWDVATDDYSSLRSLDWNRILFPEEDTEMSPEQDSKCSNTEANVAFLDPEPELFTDCQGQSMGTKSQGHTLNTNLSASPNLRKSHSEAESDVTVINVPSDVMSPTAPAGVDGPNTTIFYDTIQPASSSNVQEQSTTASSFCDAASSLSTTFSTVNEDGSTPYHSVSEDSNLDHLESENVKRGRGTSGSVEEAGRILGAFGGRVVEGAVAPDISPTSLVPGNDLQPFMESRFAKNRTSTDSEVNEKTSNYRIETRRTAKNRTSVNRTVDSRTTSSTEILPPSTKSERGGGWRSRVVPTLRSLSELAVSAKRGGATPLLEEPHSPTEESRPCSSMTSPQDAPSGTVARKRKVKRSRARQRRRRTRSGADGRYTSTPAAERKKKLQKSSAAAAAVAAGTTATATKESPPPSLSVEADGRKSGCRPVQGSKVNATTPQRAHSHPSLPSTQSSSQARTTTSNSQSSNHNSSSSSSTPLFAPTSSVNESHMAKLPPFRRPLLSPLMSTPASKRDRSFDEVTSGLSSLGKISSSSSSLTPSRKGSSLFSYRDHTHSMALESSMTTSIISQSHTLVYDEEEGRGDQGKLVQTEKMESGKVKLSVFKTYGQAAGPGQLCLSMIFFLLFQAFSAWSNFWLTDWTEDPLLGNRTLRGTEEYHDRNDFYLGIFGLFGAVQIFFLSVHNVVYWIRMVIAAKQLHVRMMTSIFRSPMSFFDTTPLGRIMNRFSRDIEVVDNNLPLIIRDYTTTLVICVVTLLVISINTPLFLSLIVPILLIYLLIQNFYIPTSRQLKRIESVTRSPIYSHFSETISGGPTIRAYEATARFHKESTMRVDRNQSFYYFSVAANRWLGMNLECLANFVILGAAVFAVVTPGVGGGAVGLSVSYAIQVSSNLVWMVRQMSDLETNIVSVERLKEYSELEPEAEWILPHRRPIPTWPQDGVVTFSNYQTRYRDGLELVLKGMTCQFKAGEKIGIVGRTGAGKSSLALAMFRLIESAAGTIIVDGVTIADIGLHDVRSRLTILPQDPVLFFGTLRMNLDPVGQYDDHQLWKALTSAHLREFVENTNGGLDYEVGEEGQSLSVGQRQLVCLARALLKKTRILILDEATAAVDMETDRLIQDTIREEFDHCTIITIAHRLNTIMDYDRIMVLDAGRIQELDTPDKLLANTDSVFYSMAKEANLV